MALFHGQALVRSVRLVTALLAAATCACGSLNHGAGEDAFAVAVGVVVDGEEMSIEANWDSNVRALGEAFCAAAGIDDPRCSHLVAMDVGDALWCRSGRKALAARLLGRTDATIPRTFRFVHADMHTGSDEFDLLRGRLAADGYVECAPGSEISGEEDAVWVLGHPMGMGRWIYDPLALAAVSTTTSSTTSRPPHFAVNCVPQATRLGDKDNMYSALHTLEGFIGDAATAFLPRTWLKEDLVAAEQGPLLGMWVRKDPQRELGAGITLVDCDHAEHEDQCAGPETMLHGCEECLLQRYVEHPLLLDGKKFSVGVYVAFLDTDPMVVYLHREMLVLLSAVDYNDPYIDPERANGQDPTVLAHLTNGLLNRRMNPGEAPECEGCAYNASEHVWTTDRLLSHLDREGISWEAIERQFRSIISTTFAADAQGFAGDAARHIPDPIRHKVFAHWRFDFILDQGLAAHLLEVEIVPSTGTIGGVDEVIKSVVLRDLLHLVGWVSPPPRGEEDGEGHAADVALCDAQILGSWARELCDKRIRGWSERRPPSINRTAFAQALERRGDALWADKAALDVIVRFEHHVSRSSHGHFGDEPDGGSNGYSLVIPQPRRYRTMAGTMDVADDDMRSASALLHQRVGTLNDAVLERWLHARELSQPLRQYGSTVQFHSEELPRHCLQCTDASHIFCGWIPPDARLDTSGSFHLQGLEGACIRASAACRSYPRGLTDGVVVSSEPYECSLASPAVLSSFVAATYASRIDKLQRNIVEPLCAALRRSTTAGSPVQALGTLCGAKESPLPLVAEVSADAAHGMAIEDLVTRRAPLVVRGSASRAAAAAVWNPLGVLSSAAGGASLFQPLADSTVTCMVYDSGVDRSQFTYTSELTLAEFVQLNSNPAALRDQLPGLDPSLYLLLTTRFMRENLAENEQKAMDPNAELLRSNPHAMKLVHRGRGQALAAFQHQRRRATAAAGEFTEAWTSVRVSQASSYPTHIDCFENLLTQLHGNKTVCFIPPGMVASIRPDPNAKHWPSASEAEFQSALAKRECVELQPGDQVYIPILWFHSVHTEGWSVTSNTYFEAKDPAHWRRHVDAKKPPEWRRYEREVGGGVGLC